MPRDAAVHVIDDDDAVRDSLEFLLRTAQISSANLRERKRLSGSLPAAQSGCIITDVRMPEISGIDLLRRLQELELAHAGDRHHRPWRCSACRGGDEDRRARISSKSRSRTRPCWQQYVPLSMRQENEGRRNAELEEIKAKLETLSGRERDVLQGLVAGPPNKTIAYDLGISPRTVEIYRANVMTKMDAASLSDLVRMAIVAGILDEPSNPKASKSS